MTQEIIRFLTAGNVDDGKSSLIGRLLYDSDSLYQDQIDEVKKSTEKNFAGGLDFSLFLDGLLSERAQKITIDVAYRYFSFRGRKFIIADAPGHEQYTRNMAVAASNSDAIIILIDAKKGVKPQTINHSRIASTFGIKNAIIAINKMDLVDYSLEIFNQIKEDYLSKSRQFGFDDIKFVPISALSGENIIKKSRKINWYSGKPIIEYLLNFNSHQKENQPLRFMVQNVVKHNQERLYQGFLSSGKIKIGDEIAVSQTKNRARIVDIIHPSISDQDEFFAPSSLSIKLDRDLDIERSSLIYGDENAPHFRESLQADLIWFSPNSFDLKSGIGQEFHLKINHGYYSASIRNIYEIDKNHKQNLLKKINTNQLLSVEISLSQQVSYDEFSQNKFSGSFLLIDKISNETLACGIIKKPIEIQKNINLKDREELFLAEFNSLLEKYFGAQNGLPC